MSTFRYDTYAHNGQATTEDQENEETAEAKPVLAASILTRSALRSLPDPKPLIDRTLDRGTVALLYGYRGSLKSFIALDWSLSVAMGRPWQNRPARRVKSLYVAAEGAHGLKGRVHAWEAGWKRQVSDDWFHVLPHPVNLTNPVEANNLAALISWEGYEYVTVDTLARCAVGADENSARDMGVFVDRLHHLLDQTPDRRGVVNAVHHTGKDRITMRGSSSLDAGVDTVYSVTRSDDGGVTLQREKRKDGPELDRLDLRLDLIDGTGSGVIALHQGVESSGRRGELFSTFLHHFSTTGCTKSELRKVSDLSEGTFYRAVDDLVKYGDVINEGTKKRPFYRVADK